MLARAISLLLSLEDSPSSERSTLGYKFKECLGLHMTLHRLLPDRGHPLHWIWLDAVDKRLRPQNEACHRARQMPTHSFQNCSIFRLRATPHSISPPCARRPQYHRPAWGPVARRVWRHKEEESGTGRRPFLSRPDACQTASSRREAG